MLDQPNPTIARWVAGINRRLAKVGIHLHPFFITREGLETDIGSDLELDTRFQMTELSEADLRGIHGLRPDMSIERYGQFLREGKRCFGIWDQEKLIAKMWLNFDDFNSAIYARPLKDDEAYLFDAFSNPVYRGKNLAPILRVRCYAEARRLGRHKIYSITDFSNIPAQKFKAKLKAKHESLRLWARLGGEKSSARVLTLKRFTL